MFLLCSSLGTHQTAQQRTGSYSVRVILPGLPVLTFSESSSSHPHLIRAAAPQLARGRPVAQGPRSFTYGVRA